jgi:aryl-alcohol dehydrogenase-like predicted oxidoreductase
MKQRRLGASGLAVSLAGLGCNNFGMRLDQDQTTEVVSAALDVGVNFFDTARSYGEGRSEEYLGVALSGRREQVVLATKFGSAGIKDRGSRAELLRSLDLSLRALRTDYIDLLQLHVPDPRTPIAETLDALDAVVRAGKVRYIGCSNFTGWMLADASWTSATRSIQPFVAVQNQWSLLQRAIETEVTAAAERFGLGVLPYFPLASGLLTGKATRESGPPAGSRLSDSRFQGALTPGNFDKVERLGRFAQDRGWSLTRLALSWLASQPVVSSVIAGATSPSQVAENAASTLPDLSPEEVAEVGQLVEA